MKRYDSLLLKVFFYGLPLLVVAAVFAYWHAAGGYRDQGVLGFMNGIAGLIFSLWMAIALYLSLRLLISESFRNQVLTRLTFVRERDERESMLTGRATRTTFMTSIALLIFLFCLSCFQVSVYRVGPDIAISDKTGRITLGLGFSLLSAAPGGPPEDATENIFTYSGLPLSGSALVLFLILWQVGCYNYSMRRLSLPNDE
jgi:hypothetical protein